MTHDGLNTVLLVAVAVMVAVKLAWDRQEKRELRAERAEVRELLTLVKGYVSVAEHKQEQAARTLTDLPAVASAAVKEAVAAASAADSGAHKSPGG